MRPTPAHCRIPTVKPNQRSARTVRKTSPPEMTAWTSESGASARAKTWRHQAPSATSMPSANHLERNSPTALRNRVAEAHVGGRAGSAMLQEEREVRREGAEERKENAEFDGQRGEVLEVLDADAAGFGGGDPLRYSRYRLPRLPLE